VEAIHGRRELWEGHVAVVAASTVTAAREGDERAFARLVDLESPAAYRLALTIVRTPAEAEDAVQDAFLQAWRGIGSLRDPDRWSPWFRRLLVRCALDRARRRRLVREVDLDLAVDVARVEPSPHPAERLALLAAFGRLDPSDRAVLSLRFFTDLEMQDVADALGIPLGTAKSRLHRALGRLRHRMGTER
jgi:RNA polymerase sigma-70 factor (ECF subfamily)